MEMLDPEGSGRFSLHGLMSTRKKAVNTIVAMVEMPSRNNHCVPRRKTS